MSKVTITRQQDSELPASVDIQFINKDTDYQQGAQQARRQSVRSIQKVSVNCPIVLDDTTARNVAEKLLYNVWIERDRFTLKLTREYAYLEPTDVITLYDKERDFRYTARIVKRIESRNGNIEFECVSDFAPTYQQNAVTTRAVITPQVPVVSSATIFVMLDLPTLREADGSTGWYVAMAGATETWGGGAIYQSIDGGNSYNLYDTAAAPATIGTTVNALGNFTGTGMDMTNTLTVTLDSGALSTTTAGALANGANLMAVRSGSGWEIIQFQTAVLQAPANGSTKDTYVLSGLVRGAFGTEWAIAGHSSGNTVVLLDPATVQRVPVPSAQIGTTLDYKVLTAGQALGSVTAVPLTYTGVSLMPYAPTGATATGSNGNITLGWTRRLRVGESVGEPQLYEVDIYDAGFSTVRRTLSGLTSPSAVYTDAMQIADFGATVTALNVRIYQVSPVVGRGYPLSASFVISANGTGVAVTNAQVTIAEAAAASDSSTSSAVMTPAATGPLWSTTDKNSDIVLSDGNQSAMTLAGTSTADGWSNVRSASSKTTGKWYVEATLATFVDNFAFGFATSAQPISGYVGNADTGVVYNNASGFGQVRFNATSLSTSQPAASAGTVLQFAIDFTAKLFWVRVGSGKWNNSSTANPATGADGFSISGIATGPYYLIFSAFHPNGAASAKMVLNGANRGQIPSGFTTWESTTTTSSDPIVYAP